MKKQANFYMIRVLAQRLIGILLFYFGSHWAYQSRDLTYFSLYLVFAVVSLALVHGVSPETLASRGKISPDTPVWDKIILGFYWILAYFVIYLIAGVESIAAPLTIDWVFSIGMCLFFFSFLLSLWAVRINPFLESVSRIQTDRCQSVCNCGPYSIIRHPAYAAILLWCIGVSMVFETKYTAICAGIIAVLIIIRTVLEDRMLLKGLAGYAEYAKTVKFRLIPYIW